MGNCFSASEGSSGRQGSRISVERRDKNSSRGGAHGTHTAERKITPAPQMASQMTLMSQEKGTYPRCIQNADGSLTGCFTAFENGVSILTITRSTDSGQNWQRIGEVYRGPTAEHDLDNPFLLQLPDGRLLCAFRDHARRNFGPIELFRLQVCQSSDGGQNWTFLSTAAQEKAGPEGVWEPFMRVATDGQSIQFYYAKELPSGKQNCLMQTSTDGGQTWGRPQIVADGGKQGVRHGMIGVCQNAGPQDLFAVMESGGSNGFFLSSVQSNDDGRTWSTPQKMYKARRSGQSCNAPQVVNLNGVLVCSFHSQEDGRSDKDRRTKVITSHDQGKTWANNTTVSDCESAWPGLTAIGPDSALIMWEVVGQAGPAAQTFHLR